MARPPPQLRPLALQGQARPQTKAEAAALQAPQAKRVALEELQTAMGVFPLLVQPRLLVQEPQAKRVALEELQTAMGVFPAAAFL